MHCIFSAPVPEWNDPKAVFVKSEIKMKMKISGRDIPLMFVSTMGDRVSEQPQPQPHPLTDTSRLPSICQQLPLVVDLSSSADHRQSIIFRRSSSISHHSFVFFSPSRRSSTSTRSVVHRSARLDVVDIDVLGLMFDDGDEFLGLNFRVWCCDDGNDR
ncbi:hypothetical protein LWI29_010098 [Acer saccharum]|uniref:Uncharacterized protein n=1 Tax=Acer saccharum TaxID=4024 RepID=A0AA39RVM9_ACESA|nr:hypothetical protein LWI29_010098 [Acer saccharum]